MFLANLPLADLMKEGEPWYTAGVLRIIYGGVKSSLFPCLIFMAVGAMTDFGPLIANPISLLLGAAAQFGIYIAFMLANATGLFTVGEAAAIGIIGGADGPTAIYVALTTWHRICCSDRRCRLFLHGADSADSAADHEASYY